MLSMSRGWLEASRLKVAVLALLAVFGLFFLFGWQLGDLTPGLSPAESTARIGSQSFSSIRTSPVNAPIRLVQYINSAGGHNGAFWMRLGSALMGIVLCGCFFYIAKVWFGKFVAVLSSLMFATTPLLIITSRSASYNILLLWPTVVMASYIWFSRTEKRKNLAWLILVLTAVVVLYIPGMLWLLPIGLIMIRKRLREMTDIVSTWFKLLSLVLIVVALVPLVLAAADQPAIVKKLLLIPASWAGIEETLKSILWSGLALIWRTKEHIPIIIGRLPILDAAQLILIGFGAFVLGRRAKEAAFGLTAIIAVAILATGINRDLNLISVAIPALALLSGAGLRYLYLQWQSVFPRNPLPRALALGLMGLLVGLHCLYGIRYSLFAWPHTVETRNTYVIK